MPGTVAQPLPRGAQTRQALCVGSRQQSRVLGASRKCRPKWALSPIRVWLRSPRSPPPQHSSDSWRSNTNHGNRTRSIPEAGTGGRRHGGRAADEEEPFRAGLPQVSCAGQQRMVGECPSQAPSCSNVLRSSRAGEGFLFAIAGTTPPCKGVAEEAQGAQFAPGSKL